MIERSGLIMQCYAGLILEGKSYTFLSFDRKTHFSVVNWWFWLNPGTSIELEISSGTMDSIHSRQWKFRTFSKKFISASILSGFPATSPTSIPFISLWIIPLTAQPTAISYWTLAAQKGEFCSTVTCCVTSSNTTSHLPLDHMWFQQSVCPWKPKCPVVLFYSAHYNLLGNRFSWDKRLFLINKKRLWLRWQDCSHAEQRPLGEQRLTAWGEGGIVYFMKAESASR